MSKTSEYEEEKLNQTYLEIDFENMPDCDDESEY